MTVFDFLLNAFIIFCFYSFLNKVMDSSLLLSKKKVRALDLDNLLEMDQKMKELDEGLEFHRKLRGK